MIWVDTDINDFEYFETEELKFGSFYLSPKPNILAAAKIKSHIENNDDDDDDDDDGDDNDDDSFLRKL